MFYFKHKNFNLSKVVNKNDLPGYIKHYIYNDEVIFAAYKTSRDHGAFTDKKIIIFDNKKGIKLRKRIYSVYYKSVSAIDITFENKRAIISLLLDNGYSVKLRFINVEPEDKVRLRLIYTCITRIANNQKPLDEDIKRLIENKIIVKKQNNNKEKSNKK